MSFKQDLEYSKAQDVKLSPLWKNISYNEQFVLVECKHKQKCGVDVEIQKDEHTTIGIDTKHIRGVYNSFYLEEYSNSINKTEGWILNEKNLCDFIGYCMWENNNKVIIYFIPFKELRNWFIKNKDKYYLHYNKTYNKTCGRIVKVDILLKELNIKKVIYNL